MVLFLLSYTIGESKNSLEPLFQANYPAKLLKALDQPKNLPPTADPAIKARAQENFNKASSLLFIENKGQIIDDAGKLHPEILFTAKGQGTQIYVTATSIHYVFSHIEYDESANNLEASAMEDPMGMHDRHPKPSKVSTQKLTVSLQGANFNPKLETDKAQTYYENYYLAHCPDGVTARSYEKFTLKEVYPGVDWVVYSNGNGFKYDFVARNPKAAQQIKLKVDGAETTINEDGQLVMTTQLGTITEDKPVSFQEGKEVATSFIKNGDGTYGFALQNAVAIEPVIIDPSVAWATYYGGSGWDEGYDCTLDANGDVFLTGWTASNNFPIANAFQSNYGGGNSFAGDAFIVKFDSAGNRFWATFYGGSNQEQSRGCEVDANGNIYITGFTGSSNFPVSNAFQQNYGGGTYDSFLVKLDGSGDRIWATFYGGNREETGNNISIDYTDNVFFVGFTGSRNFPVGNAFQQIYGGGTYDTFIVKFDGNGNRIWSTYFGGSGDDLAFGCPIDANGNVYFSGRTSSLNFPIANAIQSNYGGGFWDAFLVKFDGSGNRLWATYYGGSGSDGGVVSVVDAAGNIFLPGWTSSDNFPVFNAFQSVYAGGTYDVFIAKFTANGNPLWATYYGGSSSDEGLGCSVDASGNVYFTGITNSINFPTFNAIQTNYGGGNLDAFLIKFDGSGNRIWATYYGGIREDHSRNCKTDVIGNVYMTGFTGSNDFPVYNAFQSTLGRNDDAFLVKIIDTNCTAPSTKPALNISGVNNICQGDSLKINSIFSGEWSDSSLGKSLVVRTSGLYYLTISNACGSITSDTVEVVVNLSSNGPSISTNRVTICSTADSVLLNSSIPTGNQWYRNDTLISGATSNSLWVKDSASYTVVDNSGRCPSLSSHAIKIEIIYSPPSIPLLTTTGSTALCIGDSVVLTSSASGVWSDGSTDSSLVVRTAGFYYFTSSNPCGTVSSDTVQVVVNPRPLAPQINVNRGFICSTADSVSLTSNNPSGNQWYRNDTLIIGATSNSIWVKDGASYTVVNTSGTCPSNPSSAMVISVINRPPPPMVTLTGSTTFCAGDSVVLNSSTSFNVWYKDGVIFPAAGPRLVVKTAGAYSVLDFSSTCAGLPSTPIDVVVNPLPTAAFIQTGNLLTASPQGTGLSYQWFLNGAPIQGAISDTMSISVNGSYSVSVTNQNGCTSTSVTQTLVNNRRLISGSITIYPNPASSTLHISSTDAVLGARLIAITGQDIAAPFNDNSFNVRQVPAGIYFVEVRTAAGVAIQRVIVQ